MGGSADLLSGALLRQHQAAMLAGNIDETIAACARRRESLAPQAEWRRARHSGRAGGTGLRPRPRDGGCCGRSAAMGPSPAASSSNANGYAGAHRDRWPLRVSAPGAVYWPGFQPPMGWHTTGRSLSETGLCAASSEFMPKLKPAFSAGEFARRVIAPHVRRALKGQAGPLSKSDTARLRPATTGAVPEAALRHFLFGFDYERSQADGGAPTGRERAGRSGPRRGDRPAGSPDAGRRAQPSGEP